MNVSHVYAFLFVVVIFPGALVFSDARIDNPTISLGDRFELIWLEDFNTDEIDESVWNFNIGDGCPDLCGWGNAELQYYRRENAFIENGNLVIEARKELFLDPRTGLIYNYTSARLDTIGKLAIKPPARIEIRAKLPSGRGLWPAIWMLGEEWSLSNVRAWPSCGEIDIVELIGSEPDIIHGTVHAPYCYGARGVTSRFRLPKGLNFSQDYYVFSLEWTEDYIAWFVNGQIFHIVTKREFQNRGCMWVFNKSFHLVVNIAVGGYWPGKPDNTTQFPARMYIDYIKIYRVLKSDPLMSQNDDSDNEILVRTRGWPSVSLEKIVNGDFKKPVSKDNSPLLNPDDWFYEGNIQVIEDITASNGVLKLVINPILKNGVHLGLAQLIWVKQNSDYEIRVRVWSSHRINLTLEISLPSLPRKTYYSQVFLLNENPELIRTRYSHVLLRGNVVQLTLWIYVEPDPRENIIVYLDEVEICPVIECPASPTIESTRTITPDSTEAITHPPFNTGVTITSPHITQPSQQQPQGPLIEIAGVVIALSTLLAGILVLRYKRMK